MEPSFNQMNPQMDQAGQTPRQSGRPYPQWLLILVVLAVAAAIAWFWYASVPRGEQVFPSGERKVTAPLGKAVSNFPKELLLESGAAITESYSLKYPDNFELPVVQYVSSKPLEELVSMYRNYLLNADWSISRFADADETPATYFYAAKGKSETNITFTAQNGKVVVSIAYLTR